MSEIDRLEIQIEAEASRASKQLDILINKLGSVSSALNGVNTGGLQNMANGINKLSNSMKSMSGIKTSDFTRLTKNIEKIGAINQSKLYQTSNSLRNLTASFNGIGNVSDSAMKLGELSKNISKLGNASVQKAITNMPALSRAMKEFMTTLSSSPKVSNNLIKMTNAMSNLASTGAKYGSTINSMARATKTLNQTNNNVSSGMNKASKSFDKAGKSANSLSAQISKLALAYFALKRIVGFVGSSIEKSMDYGETINLFQTSFKKIGMETAQEMGMEWGSEAADKFAVAFIDKAQAFNDRIASALSLDPNMMMNYQAVFAQMSNSMGLVSDSAMNISESFTLLGNDIASLWNIETSSAMEKLQSGLSGQIRPLRELGVDISQTSLEMTALNYGIEDNIKDMSQAAKVQLRWLSIMEQTEVAFGDMAKTIDSPANQLRILRQQWNNLSRSIGNVFMPIVSAVLPFINALVIALRRMIDALASLLGFELPSYTDSNIYTESAGVGDLVGDYEDVEEAATGAADANEKLRKSLMGFDEVNTLSEETDSSSGGSSSGGAGGGSGYGILDDAIANKTASYLAKFQEELDKMNNKAEEMADKIVDAFVRFKDAIQPTLDSLRNLWDALVPFGKSVGTGLVRFLKDLLGIGADSMGENGWIPTGINALADAINKIDPDTAEGIGYGLGMIATAFAGFKIVGKVAGFISKISGAISTVVGGLTSLATINPEGFVIFFANMFDTAWSLIEDLLPDWATDLINALDLALYGAVVGFSFGGVAGAVIGGLVGAFIKACQNLDVGLSDFLDPIFNFSTTKEFWNKTVENFKKAFNSNSFIEIGKNIVLGIVNGLLAGISFLIEPITDLFEFIVKAICNLFGIQSPAKEMEPYGKYIIQGLVKGFVDKFSEWWSAIASWGSETLSRFKTWSSNVWDSIKGIFNEVPTWFKGKFDSAWNNIQNAFSTLGGWFSDRWNEVKSYLNEVPSWFWNKFSEAWNNVTNAFSNAPSWFWNKFNDAWNNVKSAFNSISVGDFFRGIWGTITGAFGSLWSIGKDLVSSLIRGFESISLPKVRFDISYNKDGILGKIGKALGLEGFPKLDMRFYADGGLPNMGEMFVARESGPEFVGRMGNSNVVANNDQIVESVSQGVAMAVASVMGNNQTASGGDMTIIVEANGKKLAQATLKDFEAEARRQGGLRVKLV